MSLRRLETKTLVSRTTLISVGTTSGLPLVRRRASWCHVKMAKLARWNCQCPIIGPRSLSSWNDTFYPLTVYTQRNLRPTTLVASPSHYTDADAGGRAYPAALRKQTAAASTSMYTANIACCSARASHQYCITRPIATILLSCLAYWHCPEAVRLISTTSLSALHRRNILQLFVSEDSVRLNLGDAAALPRRLTSAFAFKYGVCVFFLCEGFFTTTWKVLWQPSFYMYICLLLGWLVTGITQKSCRRIWLKFSANVRLCST